MSKTYIDMGTIKAEIELVNPIDLVLADESKIKDKDVRRMKITVLVDSGAYYLFINETIRQQLGLRHMTHQNAEFADGSVATVEMVGPVIINFKKQNYRIQCPGISRECTSLLGSIPVEGLDVVLVPLKQTIDINPEHPIVAQTILK